MAWLPESEPPVAVLGLTVLLLVILVATVAAFVYKLFTQSMVTIFVIGAAAAAALYAVAHRSPESMLMLKRVWSAVH